MLRPLLTAATLVTMLCCHPSHGTAADPPSDLDAAVQLWRQGKPQEALKQLDALIAANPTQWQPH